MPWYVLTYVRQQNKTNPKPTTNPKHVELNLLKSTVLTGSITNISG